MFIDETGPLPKKFETFEASWQAPSNIAIVKYWGKRGEQRPANPNFSFTLKNCVSETKVRFTRRQRGQNRASLFLAGRPKESFLPHVQDFLKRASRYCPWLEGVHLRVETSNSFPHGTGMASSASGMAALALCLNTFRQEFFARSGDSESFFRESSFLARLGSGSACRSLYPGAATWGVVSEEYASPFLDLHPAFKKMGDAIFIVSEQEKKTSSRVGHARMEGHLFKEARWQQARDHWQRLEKILGEGDFSQFAEICESEALSLHAMMMTSAPGALLLRPASLLVMEKVEQFRARGIPLCYTLDAGPNVHLLFPLESGSKVRPLIESELLPLVPQGRWIDDQMGEGPCMMGPLGP